MTLDILAAPIVASVVVAPAAARRLRRTAAWGTLMAYALGVGLLLGRRR